MQNADPSKTTFASTPWQIPNPKLHDGITAPGNVHRQFSAQSRTLEPPAYGAAISTEDWHSVLDSDHHMLELEGEFIEELRQQVVDEAAQAPTDPKASSRGSRS